MHIFRWHMDINPNLYFVDFALQICVRLWFRALRNRRGSKAGDRAPRTQSPSWVCGATVDGLAVLHAGVNGMQIGEQTVAVSSFLKRDERDNPAAQQAAQDLHLCCDLFKF